MLDTKDIVRLKLNPSRLEKHQNLPPPRYVQKPLTGQFTTLSDAVLTELLGIDPEKFGKQLRDARNLGVEYITKDHDHANTGISVVTSLIKGGGVMTKNMIVPSSWLSVDNRLADHIVIGAFVRGEIRGGKLHHQNGVELAGWATTEDIMHKQSSFPPVTYKTDLSVTMVPCTCLRPIRTLAAHLEREQVTA